MCNSIPAERFKYLLLVFFLSAFSVSARSNIIQAEDTVFNKSRVFKAEELIRGERLFYGLVYQANKSVNCAGCHNTKVVDELNWNPDALEISNKYLEQKCP